MRPGTVKLQVTLKFERNPNRVFKNLCLLMTPETLVTVSWVCSMTEARSFLQEIDEAVLHGSPESRARALWHATDLLIAGRYTEDQIWVFGEVIGRLADEIEGAARAKLAKRLAHSGNAPFNVIMVLASDDFIDVAGPSFSTPSGLTIRRYSPMPEPKARHTFSRSPSDVRFPSW